jgi:putative ABC transport system permease protein
MIRTILSALISHWRSHPIQLASLLAGLALATGLWSAVQAINAEARASYQEAATQLGGARLPELRAKTGTIALAQYVALRRAGWQLAPVLEGHARLGEAWVTVMGVDTLSHPALPALSGLSGLSDRSDQSETSDGISDALAALTPPGRLIARADTAAEITLATGGLPPGLAPITTSDLVPPGIVLTDIGLAEMLLDRPNQISRLLILPNQPMGLQPLSTLAPNLVRHTPDRAADTTRLTNSFHLNLTAFGLLSFAVGLFIVHGTVGLAFEQRRAMLRTLRALGVPLRLLNALLLCELMALALIAGAVGLVLGYLVAAALLPDVAATLRGLYGAPVDGSLTLRPIWFVSGLGMAVIGALAASTQALWRLTSMPLLAVPGARAWSLRTAQSGRVQAGFGLGLIGIGVLAVLLFDGLIAGFALLAGLMLGAALILPTLLEVVLRFGQARAKGPVGEWLWADMRAQLPGLSLALMALLLALAANIGVGTMVSSFRLTFTGWLEQRLASEIYVTTASDAQADELRDWLKGRVDAVLPVRFGEAQVMGQSVRVYGVIDHATYRDHWPLLQAEPMVWEQVANGTGALVNELLARREGLWPGAQISLGPDWSLKVVGVYSDYGNPLGQVIMSMDRLLAQMPNIPDRQFGLRIAPAKAPALIRDLGMAFNPPLAGVLDQASIKARSLEIFEKTFVVTSALNVLTLGVAGFAILTSLLTLWAMRLPQLAPVWALGLTRQQLARLEILRSVALAGLTAVIALPLGLLLAWALLAVINVEAFGWRLPMYLFPLDWLRLLALALLAGFVAAAIPARRLARIPPADLLGVFANER